LSETIEKINKLAENSHTLRDSKKNENTAEKLNRSRKRTMTNLKSKKEIDDLEDKNKQLKSLINFRILIKRRKYTK